LRRATVRVAAIATIALGSAAVAVPAQASFPGPNGRIVFRSADKSTFASVRPDGSGVQRLVRLAAPAFPAQPSWSADSRHIVYVVNHPNAALAATQVWVMNADGTGQRRLVADPFFLDFAPSTHRTGRRWSSPAAGRTSPPARCTGSTPTARICMR